MTIEGVDYSYDPPDPVKLAAAGKRFAVRYGAVGKPAKHLTAAEVAGLRAAGLDIVANVEEAANTYRGAAVGKRHAEAGEAFFRALGMPAHRPIYFSVDWDAQPPDWPDIDAALRASAAVLGAERVGVYGSYDVIAHCATAGTARWFWQTYAWSDGRWHPACHLQQYDNNLALAGGTVDLTRAVTADYGQWGAPMAMNPRTHPRGAPPDFSMAGLPANPNPGRITNALWWLVCMRLALEPDSRNGGVLALKPGYHSYGSRLPDHGEGNAATDHSIRWSWDRTGPWWRQYASAHDWTFQSAHSGSYTIIAKYVNRLVNAMKDPNDPRPDDVYAYTIGQADNDLVVEGYNERTNAAESGDDSHLWHRHDSFRRGIVGDFGAMWKALTIDMGWTYAEWQQSIQGDDDVSQADVIAALKSAEGRAALADALFKGKYGSAAYPNRDLAAFLRDMHALRDFEVGDTTGTAAAPPKAGSPIESLSRVPAEIASLRRQVAEGEAQDVATAGAIQAAVAELQAVRALLETAGGDPDLAPVLARLDGLGDLILTTGKQAGEEAATTVLGRLATAQEAQAAELRRDG
jgi:hypothetical protein